PVLHGPQVLQVIERDEDVAGVVLAHLGLGIADDHETVEDREEFRAADGRQRDFVAGEEKEAVLVDHRAVGQVLLVAEAGQGVTDDRPTDRPRRRDPVFRWRRSGRVKVFDAGWRRREWHLPHLVAGQRLGPGLETRRDRVTALVFQELLETTDFGAALWV